MNREDVIRMAREAGPLVNTPFDVWCDRFAALVVAAEREECAKVCDEEATIEGVAQRCADAIRARSNV